MSQQRENTWQADDRWERWALRAGRRARGRGATVLIALATAVGGLALVLAIVQRDAFSLVMSAVFLLMAALVFERRAFDRIVRRQADEIVRLRGGGGE